MPNPIPVTAPASYAAVGAIGYADVDNSLCPVTVDRPLPVSTFAAPAPGALAGSTSASFVAGPFAPIAGRPVVLILSGTWGGTVRVMRSIDGGATKLPLTAAGQPWGQFTGNVCEPVWEETAGASLYLDIALGSGTLTYRMAQ